MASAVEGLGSELGNSDSRGVRMAKGTAPDLGGTLDAIQEPAGAVRVHGGHEEGDLPGVADTERVNGLDELAAHDGGDPVAVEERLDHEGLGLIAAAAHLHQARGRLGRRG